MLTVVGVLLACPVAEANAQAGAAELRAFLERSVVEWRYVIGGEEIVEKPVAEFLPGGAIVVPDAEGYPRHDPDMLWELRDSEDGLHLMLGDPYEPTHGMAWRITSFDGRRIAAVLELPGEETIGLRLVAIEGIGPAEHAARRERVVGAWTSRGSGGDSGDRGTAPVTYRFEDDGALEIRQAEASRRGRWLLSRAEWRLPPSGHEAGATGPVSLQLLVLLEDARPAALYAIEELREDRLTIGAVGEEGDRAGRTLALFRR